MRINSLTQDYKYNNLNKTNYRKNRPVFMGCSVLKKQAVDSVRHTSKGFDFSVFTRFFTRHKSQTEKLTQLVYKSIESIDSKIPADVRRIYEENCRNLLEVIKNNPNQAKRISRLIQSGDFYPKTNGMSLSKDDPELLDRELSLYEKTANEYGIGQASNILWQRNGRKITKEDVEAKHRIFNRMHPPKSFWGNLFDKFNSQKFRCRPRIIEIANSLNENAIYLMLYGCVIPKSWHHIFESMPIKEDMLTIADNITEENKEYVEKILRSGRVTYKVLADYLTKPDDDRVKSAYRKVMERYSKVQMSAIIPKLDSKNVSF